MSVRLVRAYEKNTKKGYKMQRTPPPVRDVGPSGRSYVYIIQTDHSRGYCFEFESDARSKNDCGRRIALFGSGDGVSVIWYNTHAKHVNYNNDLDVFHVQLQRVPIDQAGAARNPKTRELNSSWSLLEVDFGTFNISNPHKSPRKRNRSVELKIKKMIVNT